MWQVSGCLSTGDSRRLLSLASGDSGDGESRQEGSEGWGCHTEMGRQCRLQPLLPLLHAGTGC